MIPSPTEGFAASGAPDTVGQRGLEALEDAIHLKGYRLAGHTTQAGFAVWATEVVECGAPCYGSRHSQAQSRFVPPARQTPQPVEETATVRKTWTACRLSSAG